MKDLKSTLIQHFILSGSLLALALTFLAAPVLEGVRHAVASYIGLSQEGLWLCVMALLIGAHWALIKRLVSTVAHPFHRLVREAEHGEQGFAFKIKSRTKEEDALKHRIEAVNLRAREAREQADDLEAALESANQALAASKTRYSDAEGRFAHAEKIARELHFENEKLKASKLALELSLENERRSKVGAEVEKRTEEIYAQMERAVSAAAYKSIWIPSLVAELKTPISIINDLSSRLKESWNQASFAQVNEEIARICEQSETQLSLLNDILARQPIAAPEPPAPTEAPVAEAEKPLFAEPSEAEAEIRCATTDATAAIFEEPPALEVEASDSADAQEVEPNSEAELPEKPAYPRDPDMNADVVAQLQKRLASISPETSTSFLSIDNTPDTTSSQYNLKNILQGLAEEFGAISENANITYAVDDDLDVVIEDDALLSLLHTLVEIAVSHLREGDITIGVDLHADSIEFDVACDGRFKERHDLDLNRANSIAAELNSEVDVDMPGASELHLTFSYRFASADSDATIDV